VCRRRASTKRGLYSGCVVRLRGRGRAAGAAMGTFDAFENIDGLVLSEEVLSFRTFVEGSLLRNFVFEEREEC
jgi:hypothetical protein